MSWLARSLVRSLSANHGDGDGDDEERRKEKTESPSKEAESDEDRPMEPGTPTRGVKEDLSELTKTLTRQFWGVASFLAPPPESQNPDTPSPPETDFSASDRGWRSDSSDPAASLYADEAAAAAESPRIAGIRSDFAEIGGKFKSGISMLSNTMAVSEISKIASTFLPFGAEEEEEDEEEEEENFEAGTVGVTKEVLAFARNISMHPETWLDFPLFHEDEDSDDFEMSNAQHEHALAIERLAPRLAALRIELCPSHMSEGCFWKIYFVLLHSRLNKLDAELLSTPQIVEARAMLLQDLQNRTKPGSERPGRGTLYRKEDATSVPIEHEVVVPSRTAYGTGPSKTPSFGEPTSDPLPPLQSKIKDFPSETSKVSIVEDEEDGDDWLEEDTGEMGSTGGAAIPLGHEEDVSFSDLEDDDDDDRGTLSSSKSLDANDSQTKDSRGWVQLNKGSGGSSKSGDSTSPESKESNDWLNVEHFDVE
ncbi:uncharacterized protein LOC103712287 isoform X2 [Phoenix dactylifera]|uniref:Uncharacterized protein LOC103712287 isoform X2 n=1 Tax=Phoenix dactylifera TaxID=42345 RepID=A0A8B7CDL1_PHODC|nr:uncharacterized protein LOC103712287 isoform X2 [Phoenix dactylifera]